MQPPAEEILVAIDYGRTNIGIAFGRNGLVAPIMVISGKDTQTALHNINRTIIENGVTKTIMGLPLTADGKETQLSREVRRFARLLKTFSKRPLEFYNEYNTSVEAETEAREKNLANKRSTSKDHLSAAVILKKYYKEKGYV